MGKNESGKLHLQQKSRLIEPALNVKSFDRDLSPSASSGSRFQNLGVRSNFRELELALGKRLVEHVLDFGFLNVLGHSQFGYKQVAGALQHFLFAEGKRLVFGEKQKAF